MSNKKKKKSQGIGSLLSPSNNNVSAPTSLGASLLGGVGVNPPSPSNSLLDFLKSNKTAVTSFDIEGTGAVGPRANITQVGYNTGVFDDSGVSLITEGEHTIHGAVHPKYRTFNDVPLEERNIILETSKILGITPEQYLQIPTEEDYIRAHDIAGAREFGVQQAERGSFNSMLEDYKKRAIGAQNSVMSLEESLQAVEEALTKNPGVLLIQNTDYENKMYESKIGILNSTNQSISLEAAARFNANVRGLPSTANLFSDTPFDKRYVQPLRDLIRDSKFIHNMSQDTEDIFRELREATEKLQDAIVEKTRKVTGQGNTIVLDLMDFTTILQNKLTNPLFKSMLETEGLKITAPMLGRNRSIETLTNILLSEEEVHTALSDAQQQNKIFYKVLDMIDSVDRGELSRDTLNYVRAMNDPANYNKDFLKTVKSRLSDIQIKAAKMAQDGATPQEIHTYINSTVPIALDDTLKAYEGTPSDEFNRTFVAEQTRKFITDPAEIKNPFDSDIEDKAPKAIQSTPPLNNNTPKGSNSPPVHANSKNITPQTSRAKLNSVIQSITKQQGQGINGIGDRLTPPSVVSSSSAKKLLQNIPNKTGVPMTAKIGLAGLATIAFLNVMAGESKKRSDNEIIKNDTYDALYDNLYVGQSYADWRERSNSHRMVY